MQRAGAESIQYADRDFAVHGARRGWFAYEPMFKRLLDLTLAVVGLVASLPICVAIAIAIKLDSPGPVIFVQERVGLRGRRFRFYKFRSMHEDAERRLAEVQAENEMDGPVFKIRNDPRVSRVGAFLRRTSLDELPQLVNVLLGDMSLVGPRPPLPREVEQYRPGDIVRLSVKPGLTCLWQIRGRSNVGFDQWMEFDREYVRNLSFLLDLQILIRTIGVVLSTKGAY
ncbi:MAG TPA: exopolysaccharide biosynthesis polyprenyl glycosylphosphotransferase [Candidatus Dormibacteraeota bacterium]|nr:exopolysaccharide biosynthesis polyprenyl glycosylphosphotransferase [Candidatus Dormibacteraeota bacterium]